MLVTNLNSDQEPLMGHKVIQVGPCPQRALVLVVTMECGNPGMSRSPLTPEVDQRRLECEDQEEDSRVRAGDPGRRVTPPGGRELLRGKAHTVGVGWAGPLGHFTGLENSQAGEFLGFGRVPTPATWVL